jgi:hypothetical protein
MKLPKNFLRRTNSDPSLPQQAELRAEGMLPKIELSGFARDKTGRLHVNLPRTGPVHLFARAVRFHPTTNLDHVNDMSDIFAPLIAENKFVGLLEIDGGGDWSTKSVENFYNYGRLWRDSTLDGLVATCFAAGSSAHNDIEHFWSPASNALTGVTLPRVLPGEDKPPSDQQLSEQEKNTKEILVFDTAIESMFSYMSPLTFDGHPTSCKPIPCNSSEYHPKYTSVDSAEIEAFLTAGIKALAAQNDESFEATQETFLDLVRHVIRRTNQLEFYKCDDESCTRCSSCPIREVSRPFFAFLQKFGRALPTPTRRFSTDNHFMTFLDYLHWSGSTVLKLDEGLPSLAGLTDADIRCQRGCNWVFTSKTERERHEVLVHPIERKADQDRARRSKAPKDPSPSTWVCKHEDDGKPCGLNFSTKYFLSKHKTDQGHAKKRKRDEGDLS